MSQRLGQHWLFDQPSLKAIVDAADISRRDTVLEVGPGLGSLTELLVARAKQVIAVEKDEGLVADLKLRLAADNLEVVNDDILQYDLRQLPTGYKVVANIPYYLTSKLIQILLESPNQPQSMALLVQKEVAERVTAVPGQMSVLAISVQFYAVAQMGQVVPKSLFKPPPKVDSALLQIKPRSKPAFEADPKRFFRLVKAGFSARRKQLKNSLAGGLQISVGKSLELLNNARLNATIRAQELSLEDWKHLYAIASTDRLV